jgi:hypothetical protein
MERGFPIPALIGAGLATLAGGVAGAGTFGAVTYAATQSALPSALSAGVGGLIGSTFTGVPAARTLVVNREERVRRRLGLMHGRQMPIGVSNPVHAQPSNARYRRV